MDELTEGLVGHWPLTEDMRDHGPNALATTTVDVTHVPGTTAGPERSSARFNGKSSSLSVLPRPCLALGTGDFSVCAWVRSDLPANDVVGDLIGQYDCGNRTGWQLAVVTNSGVTAAAQANWRNLQFGVDQARLQNAWTDHGRPGNAVRITALTVARGRLYAGTLETGPTDNFLGRSENLFFIVYKENLVFAVIGFRLFHNYRGLHL